MAFKSDYILQTSVLFLLGAATVFTFFAVVRNTEQNTDTVRDTDVELDSVVTVRLDEVLYWNKTEVPRRFVFSHYAKSHYAKYKVPERPNIEIDCGTFVDVSCELCRLFFAGLKELAAWGKTQKDVVDFAIDVCVRFKIEDPRVCKSICKEFEDELFGVAEGLLLSPEEACSVLFGKACGVPYDPTVMWNITLPDIPKPPIRPHKPPKPGSPITRVLHLTDIHIDSMYKAGSNAVCGEPLCCRSDDGKPAEGVPGAGKYGDYRNCDASPTTVEALFKHLNKIQDQFDYIFFTGDLPAHNVWNQSRQDQLDAIKAYTNMFTKYLPKKLVYNAIGNHESAPVNSFPPPFVTGKNAITWLYNGLAESWQTWLPNDTIPDIRRGAFYTTSPMPGNRIISLNTNYCNNGNMWLLLNTTDPAGQLEWLINTLQRAENNSEKVHILGHIHPGSGNCLKAWSWNYNKIINRYESTVAGQYFGHSHSDFFAVMYDDVNFTRPISTIFIPGSITTFSRLNPGYRIYDIDGNYANSSWATLDFNNYYLNLTEANKSDKLDWNFEYGAKSSLGMKNLFPEDFSELIFRMKDNDTLFQQYYSFYGKMAPTTLCDASCKKDFLCMLMTARSHDPDQCKKLDI